MIWNPINLVTAAVGIPNWVVYLLIFAVLFYLYGTWNFDIFDRLQLPHISWPLPFIGNLIYIARYGFATDEKMVKKHGKIFGVFEGRTPVIVVCDPEMIRKITVKEFDHFVNRRIIGLPINEELHGAISILKDDEWKGARSVMTPSFSGSKMKKMTYLINGCGQELCEAFREKIKENNHGEVELKYLCGCFTMDVIARTMFGVNVNSMKEGIIRKLRHTCNQLLLDAEGEEELTEEEKVSALDDTAEVGKQIQDWKVGKRSLLKSEILANSIIFLLAGYETTATTMSWMMYCLALNPDCQETLRTEINEVLDKYNGEPTYGAIASMQYLDQVFCETLRLYPAAQRSDRVCQKDCVIDGVTFPKDMVINIGIWAIHRNEEYWPEPDKFDPERFAPENKGNITPYSWIPFGSGPRNCIGMRLAILEAKIAMVHALKHFKFSPSPRTEIPVKMKPAGFSAPKTGKLYIAVEPIEV